MTGLPPMPPPAAEPFSVSPSGSDLAPRSVGWGEAVNRAFNHYATFNGRASRSEYWKFYAMDFLIYCGIIVLSMASGESDSGASGIEGPLTSAWFFAALLPFLALLVRRLHDTNHSGWFFFILFIPLVGGIWMFVLLVSASQPTDNQYGPAS